MTARSIHVLVVGADAEAVGEATVALATTGHTVSHVTSDSGTPFVWSAAEARGFDASEIDVVLSVPGHALSSVPWCENRVIDLVRSGVPLVLSGTPLASPYTAWATRCVRAGDDVVEVCERAARRLADPAEEPSPTTRHPVDLTGFHDNGAEPLTRRRCLDLLAAATMGRIGLTSGALPVILPVDYRLWHDRIVFQTQVGTRLDIAALDAVVAFEVDAVSPTDSWGWTVMVTGMARDVTESRAAVEIDFPATGWWRHGGAGHLIAVSTDVVSGCRVPSPSAARVAGRHGDQG